MITISTPITKADIALMKSILLQWGGEVINGGNLRLEFPDEDIVSRKYERWTADEVKTLLSCYEKGMSLDKIAETIPGRDIKSCGNKLNSLGRYYRK